MKPMRPQAISGIFLDFLAEGSNHNVMKQEMVAPNPHCMHSSLREKILDHLFIGTLLRCLWRRGVQDIHVLRAEVDSGGYDLVLDWCGLTRHVQLKSSETGAKTAHVPISLDLAAKPSGCVIWKWFKPDTMEFDEFLWFGDVPGKPLPSLGDKVAKHSRANRMGVKGERPNHRNVRKSEFKRLKTIDDVAEALFITGASHETI